MQSQMKRLAYTPRQLAAAPRHVLRKTPIVRTIAEEATPAPAASAPAPAAPSAVPATPVTERTKRESKPTAEGAVARPKHNWTAEEARALADGKIIRISATSVPSKAAGKIAVETRAGQPSPCSCIGPGSINQTIKSICIARRYLVDDNMDISVRPAFRTEDLSKPIVMLHLVKAQGTSFAPRDVGAGEEIMRVRAGTGQKNLAGAIAAHVRNGESLVFQAVGAGPIANTVLAVAMARLYLKDENIDLRLLPEFYTFQSDKLNKELTGVRFGLVVDKLSA